MITGAIATIGCCVAVLVALLVILNLLGAPVTMSEAVALPFMFGFICCIALIAFSKEK